MKKRIFLILFLLSFFLSGCQVVKSLQSVKESPTSGTLLFADDFKGNSNGWGTSGQNIGEINFLYDGMDIKVNNPNSLLWSVTADQYKDTQIEVDAVLLGGPSDNAFGVICRYQDDRNFYGFLLSHDGYYGIFKMENGNLALTSSQAGLKYSESIRQGGMVNHVQAVCKGNNLRLSVNGKLLAEIQDDDYSQGQIGLIAGTYEIAGIELFFDNLQIYQP